MGGSKPEEERRPDGDERDGAEEEDDGARPSSAAPDDAADAGREGNEEIDEAEKPTTTALSDGQKGDEPQAQDGDPPPRFNGITKWFNSQKGRQGGAELAPRTSARGGEGARID